MFRQGVVTAGRIFSFPLWAGLLNSVLIGAISPLAVLVQREMETERSLVASI